MRLRSGTQIDEPTRVELPANGTWYSIRGQPLQQQEALRAGFQRGEQLQLAGSTLINLGSRRIAGSGQKIRWESPTSDLITFVRANTNERIRWRRGTRRRRRGSRWLFHGTTHSAASHIITEGFDPRRRDKQIYGAGEYFSPFYAEARKYGPAVIVAEVVGGIEHENGQIVCCPSNGLATARALL